MKLKQFRVTNFRSVSDSGWIEADKVTALIGVNESGKTNLLLPLWKLRPARDGEILPTSDYPKTMFGTIRANPGAYHFIEAEFVTGEWARKFAVQAGIPEEAAKVLRVTRYYDGKYYLEFPAFEPEISIPAGDLKARIEDCAAKIEAGQALETEGELKPTLSGGLRNIIAANSGGEDVDVEKLKEVQAGVDQLRPAEAEENSAIVPILRQLSDALSSIIDRLSLPEPQDREGVFDMVVKALPTFVYYSNYGNLDSEIYLPHVVQNMKRDDLGSKEAAKARTLKVLFSFVQLQPEEILELGRDFKETNGQNREPNASEIEAIAEKKRTRSILLQSASATLTQKFRDWWKQGDYRFRFEAD
jgi:energy-coupling factor transporter ATP-binding protein EcfA2